MLRDASAGVGRSGEHPFVRREQADAAAARRRSHAFQHAGQQLLHVLQQLFQDVVGVERELAARVVGLLHHVQPGGFQGSSPETGPAVKATLHGLEHDQHFHKLAVHGFRHAIRRRRSLLHQPRLHL